MTDFFTSDTPLQRRIGLRSAVAFNMLEMIGVGPFITLPLVIAAAGYRLSVWAWVLGAVIAVADGLVWAELGAAFLCADLGITDAPRPDHAQYLDSWLRVLKADKKAIFTAESKASEAAAYLAKLQPA